MKRTVTNKMQEANRQNAQKSTGPKTPEGKQRSAKNSVRHGLLARPIFIENNENEDPNAFESLLTALYDDHRPQGGHEVVLVQRIAAGYWRLRRAYQFETQSIRNEREENPGTNVILPNPQQLDLLIRYEGMIDRELHRNIAQLHRLQSERRLRAQQKQIEEAEEKEAELTRLLPDPMTLLQNLAKFTSDQNPLNPTPRKPPSPDPRPLAPAQQPRTKRTRDPIHSNNARKGSPLRDITAARTPQSGNPFPRSDNGKTSPDKNAPQPNEPMPILERCNKPD